MAKAKNGKAAPQVEAASNTTVAGETANVATLSIRKKNPPKVRVATEKVAKVPKRVTGTLVYLATVSYNHWREYVSLIINGEAKIVENKFVSSIEDETRLGRFVKDKEAMGTTWGGYIATKPENVEKVVAIMEAWDSENAKRPEAERFAPLWKMLEQYQTVEAKPRAHKAKETSEAQA